MLIGARAFGSGILSWLGSQAAKSVLSESDDLKLEDLYIDSCDELFNSLGLEVEPDEIERLAHFFGTEGVAMEVAKWAQRGESMDARALGVIWKERGGKPEVLQEHLQRFESAYRARALQELPLNFRLNFGLLGAQIASNPPRATTLSSSFAGGQSALDSAEERILHLQTELLRQFETRLDDAARSIKEDRAYNTALRALQELETEANSTPEIGSNSELVHKLYVNLTVACDRLGDPEGTLRYAEAAVAAKGDDARSLHNLAVTKARAEGGSPDVKKLLDSALWADPNHRPAILLRLLILAEEDLSKALEQARLLEWFDSDADAQYALSSVLLRSGDRDGALAAASKAVELDGSPDQCSYLGQLLVQDDLQDTSMLMDFRARGVAEPDPTALVRATELFRKAADEYRRQERIDLAEYAETNIARVLMRLGRDEEAARF